MKRFAAIISLIFVLVLLSGCAADEIAASYVFEPEIEYRQPQRLSFDEIEYVRPDLDEICTVVYELEEVLQNGLKGDEVYSLVERFMSLQSNFETMYELAYIRSCLDVTDAYYDEEYTWCMAAEPEVLMLADELYYACANSPHAGWLDDYVFGEGFTEEYLITEDMESTGTYDEYLELMERETELLAQYRDIMAALTVEIDGQDWAFDDYVQQDVDRAYEAFCDKYNPTIAEIYSELIKLRRDYAKLMGCESYAEYSYLYSFGRDYSPEQAMVHLDNIKKHLAPLSRDVNESGLIEQIYYDSANERDLELYLETLAKGFGGQIEEAYELMKQYSMYDLSMSSDKAYTSYVAYLPDYELPYLFLKSYGYIDDAMTLSHEFGHYADSYIRQNSYETIDLAEFFSQTMQLLATQELRCVMTGDEYESFVAMNMLDILSSLCEQAALAEFELRAYEMEEPTAEKLNALYGELAEEYGIYGADASYFPRCWIEISHLFEYPFYVVSYTVSAPAALEVYAMELEEEGSGADCFVEVSASMIPELKAAMESAGLPDPLSEEVLRRSADFIRQKLLL